MITEAEALRALYIDFEGNQRQPPSFIGIRTRSQTSDLFEQIILEDLLYPALELPVHAEHHRWPANYVRTGGGRSAQVRPTRRTDTLRGMITALVDRAENEDALIVSWSSHEAAVIAESADLSSGVKDRFAHRWRDAKALAKAWKRRKHAAVVFPLLPGRGRHRLDCYMRLIGYELPSYFGDRQAAQRIDYVRKQLQKRQSAQQLTSVAKAKWTKVLDYNWHDCNGMREVTIRAATGLES